MAHAWKLGRFHSVDALSTPEQVKARLADPEKQWRKGYSAYELATSWMSADDVPPLVRAVLDRCDAYRNALLVEGHFERKVDLGTPGRPSQTDLLAFLRLKDGLAVVAVEGKVEESFGPLVGAWNDSSGKAARLEHLCLALGLDHGACGAMRYQLFHRTASALFTAERFCARQALMLVHSFSAGRTGFADFQRFAEAMGAPVAEVNAISAPVQRGEVQLRLGWAADSKAP